MSPKISKELAKHRLEQAKENLEEAEILYNVKKFKGANNRAYYSIFHSIKYSKFTQKYKESLEDSSFYGIVAIENKANVPYLSYIAASVCAERSRRTPAGFAPCVASFKKRARHFLCPARFLVTHRGFEPRTIALKVRCSTG